MKPVQKRIVIASVLKPIDDTRMFEKMAVTLAATNRYQLFLIGYPSKEEINHPNITFLPHEKFERLSLKRLLSPFLVFKKIVKVKPEVLIINSHELLIVGVLNRIIFGTPLIYDIQENYYRNLLHTKAFPGGIKQVLAHWIRLKEKLSAPFIKWFYLAEKGYEKEMTFFRKKYTVVENKALLPSGFKKTPPSTDGIQLLFSGTIAESTGVFQAIKLAHQLYQINPKVTLKIIGYCAQASALTKVLEVINNAPYIELVGGGNQLIPHHQVMEAIASSDYGIICYPSSLHTQNSIPTKLYEYLACGLPILLQNHRPWIELTVPLNAAIVVNFEQPDLAHIITKMKEGNFYSSAARGVTWAEEADKLIRSFDKLLRSEIA